MTRDKKFSFIRSGWSFTRKSWNSELYQNKVKSWKFVPTLAAWALSEACWRAVSPVIITCDHHMWLTATTEALTGQSSEQRVSSCFSSQQTARLMLAVFLSISLTCVFAPHKAVFQSKLSLIMYYFLWDRVRTQQIEGVAVSAGSDEM